MAPKIKRAMTKKAIAESLATEFKIKNDVAAKIIDSLDGRGLLNLDGGAAASGAASAAAPAAAPARAPGSWLTDEVEEWWAAQAERAEALRRRFEQEEAELEAQEELDG